MITFVLICQSTNAFILRRYLPLIGDGFGWLEVQKVTQQITISKYWKFTVNETLTVRCVFHQHVEVCL